MNDNFLNTLDTRNYNNLESIKSSPNKALMIPAVLSFFTGLFSFMGYVIVHVTSSLWSENSNNSLLEIGSGVVIGITATCCLTLKNLPNKEREAIEDSIRFLIDWSSAGCPRLEVSGDTQIPQIEDAQ